MAYQQPYQGQYQQAPAQYAQQPGAYQQQGQPYQQAPTQYAQQPQQQPQQQQGQDPLIGWFNSIDTDKSGELDANELQRALALGNLQFGLTDVDAMVRAFDTTGRRKLNLQEFSRLHAFLTSVQNSFAYFDQDRSRTLASNEVNQALRHAGFNLDPPVVQAMMSRHDPDNNNQMSLDEFIRMCLFLQSCVRTFSAFDAQRTGRITLDFGQFVYAASHIA
uniref:EF-hand domain-containing protein n=1 Tax=Chlamydomonas leiostraca TaxID=1034604 RepID=A0A7S0X1H2_9CHLO|mmetsp:Transcript_8079/g.20197  ORF Transcript_8079/g.20197 Transcript_8079/m.20197 type:complete len:219 (+) Transcript_8079:106-762(+)|eukprot:CAMPEP_0202857256 /NCGR_PEP_ID=MMETSP1391-20130828/272_1 /ASSEMBLY_ACC=CAM_ASM_000867 /TAXON_ID=1034604 /ORGANISM="Chlamydomonas leiostraca, Strain SAG 11-49" /LENGTH=218 /DNA_ID=CAMNT_0049536039 /DNA_START=78 /DNA_END=734 /DNA_ORIENTATION=-